MFEASTILERCSAIMDHDYEVKTNSMWRKFEFPALGIVVKSHSGADGWRVDARGSKWRVVILYARSSGYTIERLKGHPEDILSDLTMMRVML